MRITSILIGLAIVSLAMVSLETAAPGLVGQRRLRRGWLLDVIYWFFTALITKPVAKVSVAVALAPLLFFSGAGSFAALLKGHGPLGQQSALAQVLQMLILIDFIGYWTHRAFHGKWLWRFHAIHHSSLELDWLSAVRVHPINDMDKMLQAVAVVALGYSPILLAGALPFFAAYAIFQHANLRWDFGPLRAVLASPRFHRWHHTAAEQGRDKNFAELLPLWDMIFGTYYMPISQPTRFGVSDPIPRDLIGQLVWPFRREKATEA